MDFNVSEDQRLIHDEIVRFARKELNNGVRDRDRDQIFPKDLWLKCGEMGLQGLVVPEDFGGHGFDALTTTLALEALGYGCHDGGLVFAICAHVLACEVPIVRHGTVDQKSRYLPRLASGELIAVNGMTESTSGSDAFSIATRAVPEGDGFRLNGTKMFSSNGPVADVALVYASTDSAKGFHGGVTAFLIDRDTPGFSAGQKFEKMGLRTCYIGELVLEDVFVSERNVLGRVGAGGPIFNESMEWERACLAAAHIGKMAWLLEEVIAYSKTRKSAGLPIASYQAVSHKIADMKIKLEAARLLTYKAAWQLGRARDVGMHASITKVFVSEALVESALSAVRLLGGYGFMTEYDVERVLRDSVGGVLYSGTNEVQRNIIGKWLGL